MNSMIPRAMLVLFLPLCLMAGDDIRFSIGARYWASTVEVVQDDGGAGTTVDGSGALGGVVLGLSKGRFAMAFSYLDDISKHTIYEIAGIKTDYEKRDIDLTFNYALSEFAGLNAGLKQIDAEFVTHSELMDPFTASIDLKGLYAGGYISYPVDSLRSRVAFTAGYGFLSTSDLEFSDGTALETDNAKGPTAELAWHVLLGNVVLSASYKYQDFKYDVTRTDPAPGVPATYEDKDLTKGFVLSINYFF